MELIGTLSNVLWFLFIPPLVVFGGYIIYRGMNLSQALHANHESWHWEKVRNALSVSLASKIGTGAIIGVLAAMWQSSDSGYGGEGLVLWVIIGMSILLPITWSEVLFTQISRCPPQALIRRLLSISLSRIYAISLVALYAFGFVGFQFSGIQTLVGYIAKDYYHHLFSANQLLCYIVIPIVFCATLVVISGSHSLFIRVLSSLIMPVIFIYMLFFAWFVFDTRSYFLIWCKDITNDFFTLRSVALGLPLGLLVGFQRIIQISETVLGTSSLCSIDSLNSPRREAAIQTLATFISVFIAVVITCYIFCWGRSHLGVMLSGDGRQRIYDYISTVYAVAGDPGLGIISAFFVISGFTTILGSFYYVNTVLNISRKQKAVIYIFLITASGLLSVNNFTFVFDASNLLMFIVAGINLLALTRYGWLTSKQNKCIFNQWRES